MDTKKIIDNIKINTKQQAIENTMKKINDILERNLQNFEDKKISMEKFNSMEKKYLKYKTKYLNLKNKLNK